MLFKQGELKLLWPFYLNMFVYGLSTMIFPFITLYYLDLGFSFFQISIINAAYGISMFLFEIPTGAFADGFSRKYSVALGSFIVALSILFIPFTFNFYLIVVLYALAGIGMTFVSGAEEAWVIDNLNKAERKDLHQEYFIKNGSIDALGATLAPIIGAVIIKVYSLKILWFVYAIGYLLSGITVLLFTKEYFKPQKLNPLAMIKTSYHNSKMGLVFSIRHKVIFFSILAGLCMQLMFIGNIGIQPFLLSLGMAEHQLGYMYSIGTALGLAASFLSRYFVKFNPGNLISIVIFIVVLLRLSLWFIEPPFFITACIVFIINGSLFTLVGPIIQTYFHKFIPGKIRATVVSTKSMADQLIIASSSLGAGALLDVFGPQKVLALAGLLGIVAMFFYQKIKN